MNSLLHQHRQHQHSAANSAAGTIAVTLHNQHMESLTTNTRPLPINNPTNSMNSSSNFIRRFIFMLISLFIIISIIFSIAWIILKPQPAHFILNSFTVSNFTLSDSQETNGKYVIQFTVTNPNKKINLYFQNFSISVKYRKTCLSKTWVASRALLLEKLNQTSMSADLDSNSTPICCVKKNDHDLKELGQNLISGVINLKVEMVVSTIFRAGKWLSMERSIFVSCKNLRVTFLPSNKLVGKLTNSSSRENCRSIIL